MERLTWRVNGEARIMLNSIEICGTVADRLAAIEDILGDEYDLDRLTPCTFCQFNPPSSSDGKPCCMCPAEAALRREQDGNNK